MMARIVQKDNGEKGRFIIYHDDDAVAGEMTYVWADDSKFIIDHTEVNEAFGGKGYAKQLVMKAVEFARKQEVKIIPLCPFAARVFAKDPDLQDVKF